MDFISSFTIKNNDDSTVTISGAVPFEELKKHRGSALKDLGKDIAVDGFRKGQLPEKMIIERVGEMKLLGEMAERALSSIYPTILTTHKIEAIGYPNIQITKLAPENPLEFTATVAILPTITLPEYKTIAKEVNIEKETPEVSDAEVEKQIKDILRQKIAYEKMQKKATETAKDEKSEDGNSATDLPTPESVAKDKSEEEDVLPELTDEYVKTLGQPGQFENVADFKSKLKEHLVIEKTKELESKHRAKITDTILSQTEITLPQVLIDSELNQMFAQMSDDLARSNLKVEDYLTHLKKTKEELMVEWQPVAEKRAKLQLILNEIAKNENITPDEKELKTQTSQILDQFKEADETRVKVYVATILTNEAVMKMLETA